MPAENQTIIVRGLSNREFLDKYAHPGRIGLSGGISPVDMAICRAERHLSEKKQWGTWTHAFLFQGTRADGHHWIIESNMEFHRRNVRVGAQENRVTKFHDENSYTTLAVLDFGLTDAQVKRLISEGLEFVATQARYSMRELLGTLFALRHQDLRTQDNVMARERSMFCSAFVHTLFRKTGIDLAPGVHEKNTTPEDISLTSVPHTTYLLERQNAREKIEEIGDKLRPRLRARVRRLRQRMAKR
jgi:hypothetical protein